MSSLKRIQYVSLALNPIYCRSGMVVGGGGGSLPKVTLNLNNFFNTLAGAMKFQAFFTNLRSGNNYFLMELSSVH